MGKLKNCKSAHIKLKPGTLLFKGRYYNLPMAYKYTAKKEIQCKVDIGVLKELLWHDDSPWTSLTFKIPKNTGNIRIITDFRELNKWVEVNPFPLPMNNETLQKLDRFKSATTLDLSFGYIQFYLMKKVKKFIVQSYHGEILLPTYANGNILRSVNVQVNNDRDA